MTQRNTVTVQPIIPGALAKRMLLGAGIAFILIGIFLLGVDNPDPAWPKFWMIRPLLVVPITGALGGAFSYSLDGFRHEGGWKTLAAIVVSLIGYVIALWIGSVLGLDGTMWN